MVDVEKSNKALSPQIMPFSVVQASADVKAKVSNDAEALYMVVSHFLEHILSSHQWYHMMYFQLHPRQ